MLLFQKFDNFFCDEDSFGNRTTTHSMTAEIRKLVNIIEKDMYQIWKWNYLDGPAFGVFLDFSVGFGVNETFFRLFPFPSSEGVLIQNI